MRANQCCICGAEMSEGDQVCARCQGTDFHCVGETVPVSETVPNCGTESRQSAEKECAWCGPGRVGWFSVQFWVRSGRGQRKWMSVTQQYKRDVRYCPMCGRKLEEKQ